MIVEKYIWEEEVVLPSAPGTRLKYHLNEQNGLYDEVAIFELSNDEYVLVRRKGEIENNTGTYLIKVSNKYDELLKKFKEIVND